MKPSTLSPWTDMADAHYANAFLSGITTQAIRSDPLSIQRVIIGLIRGAWTRLHILP